MSDTVPDTPDVRLMMAAATVAAVLFTAVLMAPVEARETARADGLRPSTTPEPHTRAAATEAARSDEPGLRGTMLAFPRPRLDARDRNATLRAIQTTLDEVGDGANYVWYRAHGRLSGVVRPVRSFADARGRICRNLMITLRSGPLVRSLRANACRGDDGGWSLER